eukprot:scaffold91334_cov39-Tisochrysis_lutea.AAC.2
MEDTRDLTIPALQIELRDALGGGQAAIGVGDHKCPALITLNLKSEAMSVSVCAVEAQRHAAFPRAVSRESGHRA